MTYKKSKFLYDLKIKKSKFLYDLKINKFKHRKDIFILKLNSKVFITFHVMSNFIKKKEV